MCNKLKEQDTNTLHLSFDELKKLSNYSPETRNIKRFVDDLQRVYDKMLDIRYTIRTETKIKKFVLFYKYEIDISERYLEIATSPDLKYILNSITSNFTKFELKEMTNLKSTYSKNMFRILKQYKHTGYMKIKIDDFRERLDVPKSYRMTDINKNVLKPIVTELNTIFNNLHINKIKAKKGRKIEWLEFIFDAEKCIHSKRKPERQDKIMSKRYSSREKTPKWLEKKIYTQSHKIYNEDTKLRQDREAFQRQLKEKWENK